MKSLKLGRDTGSLTNYLLAGSKQPEPVEGMGATIVLWTDRHAATITGVRVIRGVRTVFVQEDIATRTDKNGLSESQEYSYAPNPEAREQAFTLRQNGAYVERGEPMTGTRLVIDERDAYEDPSF